MLGPGDTAPAFTLPDHAGRPVTRDALLGAGPLILFFYPGDFTPVCTREVCLVRDAHAELGAAGLAVAGVSPDDADTHARFRERYSLDYLLLADPGKAVIRAFGVDGPLGLGVRRATFLIGRDGRIVDAVRADLRLSRHAAFVRRALETQRAAAGGLKPGP